MLNKVAVAGMVLLGMAGQVKAQDGPFTCVDIDKLADVTWNSAPAVRLNNFNVGERKAHMAKGVAVIEASFSVANRSAATVHVTGQFVGYDGSGNLLFALSASPMMDMVSANKTETAQGDIYVAPGTIQKLKKMCVTVEGQF